MLIFPEVVVYEHARYGGVEWRTNLNHPYVGDWWNDKISSIIVVSGAWRFFEHANYGGAYWDLGPGYYASLTLASDRGSNGTGPGWYERRRPAIGTVR